MVKMDLKKILALAMVALMAIPSLTMVVRADEPDEGAGPAGAIERARIYLDKVITSAEKTASLYPEDHMIHGYLNELYELLGTEILLETTGDVGDGNESRIVILMPEGFTLGDLETLSWSVNTTYGYPPHVDVFLDTTDPLQSVLTAELAVNNPSYSPPTYGTYDIWLKTFEMASTDGYDVIDNNTVLWVTKLGGGDKDAPSSTLANWKLGIVDKDPGSELPTTVINSETPVLKLEIEVDNWIAQTKAYVDDIEINGVTKTTKYYLDQASDYLDEGDNKSAARSLASARNILGRINGLLKSMAKTHKVTRTEKFNQKFQRRIQGIKDKIERQKGPKK